ncbi:monooxygenase [Oleiphilus messinensis]|uniref:Monooxygenase n=1 Tax=Oleiphilus messinensis TaxID=141451 RepID=A0A1Y0IB98_9GAMM|nr:NAD(P)/FAD-dependent oxidoreductase [Oleiphilus messinensis]ARU56745.1 monooxygenase [Oleiphilus messinensis]
MTTRSKTPNTKATTTKPARRASTAASKANILKTNVSNTKVSKSNASKTPRKNTANVIGIESRSKPKLASVVIIGAGFAGIGMAIRLQQSGIKDFIILERGSEVGGTWRDNQYPGAACDIPSNLYSYSFAQNPNWSKSFSGSREILDYIKNLVKEHNLESYIRFNCNVVDTEFHEEGGIWNVTCENGNHYCGRAMVMAQGPLSNASLPNIEGVEDFEGHKIHSARWDHNYDFKGKKVAVIGTGASAVQIIPELIKEAEHVKVFQRTAAWVMPRPDFNVPNWNKALFSKIPATQRAVRNALYLGHEAMALAVIWNSPLTRVAEKIGAAHLKNQVKDKWLRRQLTPNYKIGCKRVLVSNDYYPALQQENCKLITWPINKISASGIKTVEGIEHQVDCIVFATGFDVCKSGTPFPVRGLEGVELSERWARGAKAYKSISVTGYPNLFMIFGPNSGPGHNSALVYMESQLDYAVKGISKILSENLKLMDVRSDKQRRFNADIQRRLAKTNWNSGCKSWYLTEDGFNATMYPGFASQFKAQMEKFKSTDYRIVKA